MYVCIDMNIHEFTCRALSLSLSLSLVVGKDMEDMLQCELSSMDARAILRMDIAIHSIMSRLWS